MNSKYNSPLRRFTAWLLGLALSPVKATTPISLDSLSSVLILRNDALGDAVVTTPVWRHLKRAKAGLRIGVVASKSNQDILKADPDIDEVFASNDKGLLDESTLKRVRKMKWDVTVCLKYNNKTKSAFLARKLAPRSITSTVAFNDDPRYDRMFSVVSRQERNDHDHMTEIIRKHLRTVIEVETNDWHPNICIPADTISKVEKLLTHTSNYQAGFVHVNLHASLPVREWSIENVIAFCRRVRYWRQDLAIVITGDPRRILKDQKQILSADVPGVLVLPELTQLELCAVVRQSRLVLTPDTALTHIASAERKPVVTLHYRKNEWYPYGVPHEILYSSDEHSVCDIPVDQVLSSVQALLTD